MNPQEFSTEFDVLFNNVTSNQAPGLNEYEKSVFLTKAQSQLVNEYFNSRTDGFGGGFDGSQKRQYDFSSITRIENLLEVNSFGERVTPAEKLDRRSRVFLFPQNYFLAVNEILSDDKWQYSITPISHSEYQRLMLKPYNFPVKRGAWRLITNKKVCNCVHEDPNGKDLGELVKKDEYTICTSWADFGRNLELALSNPNEWDNDSTNNYDPPFVGGPVLKFKSDKGYYCKVVVTNNTWSTDSSYYRISLKVTTSIGRVDDAEIFRLLKEGFKKGKASVSEETWNASTISIAANYTDGFTSASAPSNFKTIQEGRTFNFKTVLIPTIELIGKFTGDIQYQLRYIRSLTPIILEDLDNYGTDLTIDGVTKITPCELPEETHQEILERAVTLAKIAWQGGTMTGAAQQAKNG